MGAQEDFLQARLTKSQQQLDSVDAAILQVTGGAQMYSLDSGQTRQMVTRASLGQLKELRKELEAQILDLMQRLNCGGTTVIQPGW